MRRKIFASLLFISLFSIVLSSLLGLLVFYGNFQTRLRAEVQTEASYVQAGVELSGTDYLRSLGNNINRITLISPDGTVLFDNQADSTLMENHGNRPEVSKALRKGFGNSTRISNTLSAQTYYYALRLENGAVLRVASTTDSVLSSLFGLLPWIIGAALLIVLFASILSRLFTKKIVAPINSLDLDHPTENVAYEELTPLLTKIHRQNQVISRQLRSLREKQEEFTAITENMSEGFLIVGSNTEILSYNSSALRLLGAEPWEEDSHPTALQLNRSPAFRRAIDSAIQGTPAQELLRHSGSCCQIMANPVFREQEVTGAVLVILDVTEREDRERLRREFTANVSHELKTPLTSISGFAEIMEGGLVKSPDIPRFAGFIYQESQRLIALVDDILDLSRLEDSSSPQERQQVELNALALDICNRLRPAAQKQGVTLRVQGSPAFVNGVPRILEEMIYNLCDNGIKYNRKDGLVTVLTKTAGREVRLQVTDTGIGIPPADHSRVFERFYRVDKSHSKEIGGTGLGLSIVKHGAALHNAQIFLESTPQKGTTITLVFPTEE